MSKITTPSSWILLATAGLLCLNVACATTGAQQAKAQVHEKKVTALQDRLEELERTNGRLGARVEELEDQVFLLHDRVESARMMLQRRRVAMRPSQAPETYYQETPPQPQVRRRPRKPLIRIQSAQKSAPVAQSDQPTSMAALAPKEEFEGEIVMTNEAFERMYGPSPNSGPSPTTTSSSSSGKQSSSGKRAQPSVTQEKIALNQPKTTRTKISTTGIRLYKESLAHYRSGQYAQALRGFQSFLAASPKVDYVDNALYWIGECHYGLKDYSSAVKTFSRLMSEQPEGNKVPDAMLKMSMALEQTGQGDRAKEILKSLTSQYPSTNAAKLGRSRLGGS